MKIKAETKLRSRLFLTKNREGGDSFSEGFQTEPPGALGRPFARARDWEREG